MRIKREPRFACIFNPSLDTQQIRQSTEIERRKSTDARRHLKQLQKDRHTCGCWNPCNCQHLLPAARRTNASENRMYISMLTPLELEEFCRRQEQIMRQRRNECSYKRAHCVRQKNTSGSGGSFEKMMATDKCSANCDHSVQKHSTEEMTGTALER